MDEKPIQLFSNATKSFRSQNGRTKYEDYEYIRNGTASIFLFTEPFNGWRYTHAEEHRTREDWARKIEWLLETQYPSAKKVVLVMDNLSSMQSLRSTSFLTGACIGACKQIGDSLHSEAWQLAYHRRDRTFLSWQTMHRISGDPNL